jgi:hypothetical protein
MLRRGYSSKNLYHISVLTGHFAQLFGKKPAYDSVNAYVMHCWETPRSIQYDHVGLLIRAGAAWGVPAARNFAARSSIALEHMRRGIMYNDSLFNAFARSYEARSETDMSMAEYLESCRGDPMRYANAAERLLAAIGEPQMIDTAKDPRLGRIFLNRTMRAYPAFVGFHGMEETIERIVGFFRHAAQGLEERKQILNLLGPVGGGKSSLAERLKSLMEVHPIYVLKAGDELMRVKQAG